MSLSDARRQRSTPPIRRINAFYAMLLRVLGPPDLPDGPLAGTRYDPQLTQRRDQARVELIHAKSIARWQRWDQRLHGHHPIPPPWWAQTLEAADHDSVTREPGSNSPHRSPATDSPPNQSGSI